MYLTKGVNSIEDNDIHMVEDLKGYFTELTTPIKTAFQTQETTKTSKIATLKSRLSEAMLTAQILSTERRRTLALTKEFKKYLDMHITLLKEFPDKFPEPLPKVIPRSRSKNLQKGEYFDINELCKKIMYTMYVDVMLNETGTELYKFLTAQLGLHPTLPQHKVFLTDSRVEVIYDMALIAITDGTCDELVMRIKERIRSLKELKTAINGLEIMYKREPLNKKVIKPLKEIKQKYWLPLNRKRVITIEDEALLIEALEYLSKVETQLQIILPRLENALSQHVGSEVWTTVTSEDDQVLNSLQRCAIYKWYERHEDLTGYEFRYDVAFAVALRKRAKERMNAIERSSGLLGENGFDLHRRSGEIIEIKVWDKEVMFSGRAIEEGHSLVDSSANKEFLTKDETNKGPDPLLDKETNIEFLEKHYQNNRHKESNLIDAEEYEEYLKFKAGQRENGRRGTILSWASD